MDPESRPLHFGQNQAIHMAVFSGNLLYGTGDERHFWALTLIAFNLFELVGDAASAQDRFTSGYEKLVGHKRDNDLTHGWHEGCVARAIRNLFVHGMKTEQTQRKNYNTGESATVRGVTLIAESQLQDPPELYHIELLDNDSYATRFSPPEIWYYVQQWHEYRRLE
ncbi:MAG: hypothetical protein OXG68_10400 [Chloroflexi bacterium]|nr:hypothetical protein [Chloroflexota bacterium]